jgi:hypothetical protein
MNEKTYNSVKHFILNSPAFQGDKESELQRLNQFKDHYYNDGAYFVKLWNGAGYWLQTFIVYAPDCTDTMVVLETLFEQIDNDKIPAFTDEYVYGDDMQNLSDDEYEKASESFIWVDPPCLWIYSENLQVVNFSEYDMNERYY